MAAKKRSKQTQSSLSTSERIAQEKARDEAKIASYGPPDETVELEHLGDYYAKFNLKPVDAAWDPKLKKVVIFVINEEAEKTTTSDAGDGAAAGQLPDPVLRNGSDSPVSAEESANLGTVRRGAPDDSEAVMPPPQARRFWD